MSGPHYWKIPDFLSRIGPFVLARSPKVAMTSILLSLEGAGLQHERDTVPRAIAIHLRFLPIVLFVRHPFERFKSAWNAMAKNGSRKFSGYEEFVDEILDGSWKHIPLEDKHWQPQSKIHTELGVFLPTTVYRFERIQEVWPTLLKCDLRKDNVGDGEPISNYRKNDVLALYAEDLELWDKAH